MTAYPVFARIRAERAAKEMHGAVLLFPLPVKAEPMTWSELYGQCFDAWVDTILDIQDAMRHAAKSTLDEGVIDFGIIRAARQAQRMVGERMEVIARVQERNRQAVRLAEAEHTGRLIRELGEET
jgi:hypothetical protein